jgi:hypothetical protein
MPQRDIYHDVVIKALIQDGWTITDDPLRLAYAGRNVYVDLGAEQPIGAERAGRKIAVEIKSFLGESDIHELSVSVGQYKLYRDVLEEIEPERELYLAVPTYAYDGIFQEPIGQLMIHREQLRIMVFDDQQERIRQWIP